jgi:hypothetical protein
MLFGGALAFYPYDETGAVSKAMRPVIRLDLGVAYDRVGDVVRSSLARSAKRRWLPWFLRQHGAHSEALRLLGASSERTFLNKGAVVHVTARAEHLELARLLRDKGGWRGEPSVTLPLDSSSAELGRAVVDLITSAAAQQAAAADAPQRARG